VLDRSVMISGARMTDPARFGGSNGLADGSQLYAAATVGEEAEVADAVEAIRQGMQQEAANELARI
jgi:hypothetical protein